MRLCIYVRCVCDVSQIIKMCIREGFDRDFNLKTDADAEIGELGRRRECETQFCDGAPISTDEGSPNESDHAKATTPILSNDRAGWAARSARCSSAEVRQSAEVRYR